MEESLIISRKFVEEEIIAKLNHNQQRSKATLMAKVISVIETEILRGKGVENDPARTVTQYWSIDGELLAERDPVNIEWESKKSHVEGLTGVQGR